MCALHTVSPSSSSLVLVAQTRTYLMQFLSSERVLLSLLLRKVMSARRYCLTKFVLGPSGALFNGKWLVQIFRNDSRALFIASVNNRDFHTPVHVGNLPDFLYHLNLTGTTTYHHRQPLARTFGRVSLVMLVTTFVSQKVI